MEIAVRSTLGETTMVPNTTASDSRRHSKYEVSIHTNCQSIISLMRAGAATRNTAPSRKRPRLADTGGQLQQPRAHSSAEAPTRSTATRHDSSQDAAEAPIPLPAAQQDSAASQSVPRQNVAPVSPHDQSFAAPSLRQSVQQYVQNDTADHENERTVYGRRSSLLDQQEHEALRHAVAFMRGDSDVFASHEREEARVINETLGAVRSSIADRFHNCFDSTVEAVRWMTLSRAPAHRQARSHLYDYCTMFKKGSVRRGELLRAVIHWLALFKLLMFINDADLQEFVQNIG